MREHGGTPKKFELYFSDRLTLSNIRGRTSRQIYRLTLLMLSPEMLSSSSKSRIFLFNAHLALFVRMDDTITRTNTSSFVIGFAKSSTSSKFSILNKYNF